MDIQCPAHLPATNCCFKPSLYLLTEPCAMWRIAINHRLSAIKFCKHCKLKPKPPFTYLQFAVSMRLFWFSLHCTDPGTETLPVLLALHPGMCVSMALRTSHDGQQLTSLSTFPLPSVMITYILSWWHHHLYLLYLQSLRGCHEILPTIALEW